jgi:hypothetical protein
LNQSVQGGEKIAWLIGFAVGGGQDATQAMMSFAPGRASKQRVQRRARGVPDAEARRFEPDSILRGPKDRLDRSVLVIISSLFGLIVLSWNWFGASFVK